MRRLVLALILAATLAVPAAAEFPFPIPIPIPGGNGGSFPIPIPQPGGDGGLVLDIPIPTGGTIRVPLPNPSHRRSPQPQEPAPLPLPGPSSSGRPSGYGVLTVGGRVARVRSQDLPLKLYSQDSRFDTVFTHAVNTWNEAGYSLGLGQLFSVVVTPSQADVPVDWTGRGLGGSTVGSTQFSRTSASMTPVRVAIHPDVRPAGALGEVVIHELGHVLGLDHSEDPDDVLASYTHRHRHEDLREARLSARDQQMLRWLYSQTDFAPIVPRASR